MPRHYLDSRAQHMRLFNATGEDPACQLGAAVNIIAQRGGPTLEIVPELSGGSFGFQKYRAHGGGTGGPVDYYFAETYSREDGWRDASAVRLGRAFGKLGYRHGGEAESYVSGTMRHSIMGERPVDHAPIAWLIPHVQRSPPQSNRATGPPASVGR